MIIAFSDSSARMAKNYVLLGAMKSCIAEMAASGIIAIVPADTVQSEIFGIPEQQYASVDEAAKKLVILSLDASLDERLQGNVQQVRDRFLPASFIAAVQNSAQGMLPRQANLANI